MISKEFNLQSDIQKYHKKMTKLYKEKKQIVENIKSLSIRQKMMGQNNKEYHHTQQSLNKQIKVTSQIPSHNTSTNINEHPHHLDTQQEDIKKFVQIHEPLKTRNIKLFSGLNNYLKKASNKLQQQASVTRQKRKIEQSVLKKERQQSLQFQQQKRKEIKQNLQRLTLQKDNNCKQMLQTENIILKHKFIAYVSDLQNFLFTKTQPSISWKPAAANQNINQIKSQSYQLLKKKTEKTVEQIMNYNEKFDFNAYRLQNQRQFYKNHLDNYFKSKTNFILTKTTPSIAWMPAKNNQKTLQALGESKKQLQAQLEKTNQDNESYYKRFQKQVIPEEISDESLSEH